MKKLKQKILEQLRKIESQKNFQIILKDFKGVPVSQLYIDLNYQIGRASCRERVLRLV